MTETQEKTFEERLVEIGGREWQKDDRHRIYFNRLINYYAGLDIDYYKSGSISYAELDGQKISNSAAGRISARLYNSKVYWDIPEGRFVGQDIEDEDYERIVKGVTQQAEEVE